MPLNRDAKIIHLPVLFFCLILLSITCRAEGTKQIRPDSTYTGDLWITYAFGDRRCFANDQCDPDQKLFIHIANPGEKIFMGFYANGAPVTFKLVRNGVMVFYYTVTFAPGSKGCIQYHSQAVAGPLVLNPQGYNPLTFVPGIPGEYSIEFIIPPPPQSQEIPIRLFDITVIDTTKTPFTSIDGRLWSKDWGFNTYTNSNLFYAFLAKQYILTTDSIVTSLNYNHMRGWNFDVTSTRNGCFPWPYRWDSSCMSRPGNNHYAEYKIFISDPDTSEYPTGTLGVILGDTVNVIRDCDGEFHFQFAVNKQGDVKLNIESNLSPGIQPEDLTIKHSVLPGVNTLHWDGLNALGAPVPCGDSIAVTMNYINGLSNVALYDVETHPQGFIIELVRPPGTPIATYWNDTLLKNKGGRTQLDGCYALPPDSGCHKWIGNVGVGIGSMNTINTWWYAVSSLLDLGRFRVECVPHKPQGISGPLNPCTYPIAVYTVDPDPLPGSEPDGYEWILTDYPPGNILFDSADAGSSIGIDFTQYPSGTKRLKVRGRNNLCGTGMFGPGISGEGITIVPASSPQITNSITSFSICSGDSIHIMLQSDMPGTTFSYTAEASSAFVTGYQPGTGNPVSQQLFNSGTTIGSVIYSVVPWVSPCSGDTIQFVVMVSPADSLTCTIRATSNPVCENTQVTLLVDPLIGGPDADFSWFLNGLSTGQNLPELTFVPSEGDSVQCIITSEEFCTPGNQAVSNTVTIHLAPELTPEVALSASASPVCEGDSVTLTAIPVNGGATPEYSWFLNGINSGVTIPTYTFLPANEDEVICRMLSGYFCLTDTLAWDTLLIEVRGPVKSVDTTLCFGVPYFAGGDWQTTPGIFLDTLPVPAECVEIIETNIHYKQEIHFDLGSDQPLCSDYLVLRATFPGAAYLWQDGSFDSLYMAFEPGVYFVKLAVEGCFESDTIVLDECPVKLWIPDAFTPNGDGLNDTFRPAGEGIEKFSMRIYDRWGKMVCETTSLEPGWDGTYKGEPSPDGTYVYMIITEEAGGEIRQLQGTVVLLR
jgi:gliding motility-associated-like protein